MAPVQNAAAKQRYATGPTRHRAITATTSYNRRFFGGDSVASTDTAGSASYQHEEEALNIYVSAAEMENIVAMLNEPDEPVPEIEEAFRAYIDVFGKLPEFQRS